MEQLPGLPASIEQLCYSIGSAESKFYCQEALALEFAQRPAGNMQEVGQLRIGSPARAFRDIGHDRYCGSAHLCSQPKTFC